MIMTRLLLCLAMFCFAAAAHAQSLGQLVNVEGVRENQLTGYGIVVGLPGTGDGSQAKYTSQSIKNMLNQFGVRMPDNAQLRARNTAAVMVSANFPPGYR
jgi:flagellar P-ring protein FlgI